MAKDVDILLKARSGRGGVTAPQRRRKDDICCLFKKVVGLASKGEQVTHRLLDKMMHWD